MILSPRAHGQCLKTLFIVTAQEQGCYWIKWVKVGDAAKHPAMHGAAPDLK